MMLRCVGQRGARVFVLASVVGLATSLVGATTAEARSKRHGQKKSHAARSGGYAPPFAAYVVDANSGRVLHGVNEDAPRHPASVTKVMTLYLVFEQLERGMIALDTEFKVSAHAAAQPPSKLGLRPGQTIEVEDAIKALVTKSANDVASTIAENLAGSEEEFAEKMTRKARQLGMSGTVYRNASGLPDREQITTARDLAILGKAVQERFPRYYRYFQTRTFNFAGRSIGNHNRLLGKVEGVDGIKTGFTNASGFNLLTSARVNGRHVIGVVLGGRSGASRDTIMAGLIRTNLARASVGASSTAYASADERFVPAPEARPRAFKSDVETAAATTGSTLPVARPLDLGPPRSLAPAPAQMSEAATKPIPTPPTTAQKIEARLPLLPAAPEPPARIELASAKVERPVVAAETPRESAKPAVTPWVIQLAAEEDEKQARAVLDDARSRSGRLLAKAAPFTEKVNRGGSTLYRARFSGFAEADSAQEACRTLKRSGFACFATRS